MIDLNYELYDALGPLNVPRPLEKQVLMVVDLFGSTPHLLKIPSATSLPVMEMILHNSIAAAWVGEWGGKVVKFLGDGLLALWDGRCDISMAVANAARCAVDIMERAQEFNQCHDDQAIGLKVGLHVGAAYACDYKCAVKVLAAKGAFNQYFPSACLGIEFVVPPDDPHGVGPAVAARIASWANPGQALASEDFVKHLPGDINVAVSDYERVPLKGLGRVRVSEIACSDQRFQGIRNRRYVSADELASILERAKDLYEIGMQIWNWGTAVTQHVNTLLYAFDSGKEKVIISSEITYRVARDQILLYVQNFRETGWKGTSWNDIICNELKRRIGGLLQQNLQPAAKGTFEKALDGASRFQRDWRQLPLDDVYWEPLRNYSFSASHPEFQGYTPERLLNVLGQVCLAATSFAPILIEACDTLIKDLIAEVRNF